jgi:hypothetical protein
MCSPLPRSHQALHASPPRSVGARIEGLLQPEIDVDRGMISLNTIVTTNTDGSIVDAAHLFSDEPDAFIWNCIIRYLRSALLAQNDDGQ